MLHWKKKWIKQKFFQRNDCVLLKKQGNEKLVIMISKQYEIEYDTLFDLWKKAKCKSPHISAVD